MKPDYYELLGVSRTATDADIKQAFRRLARELHPDVNASPDATARFQQVNEAYQVLSDPRRRSTYDRTGAAPRVRVRPARKPPTSPPEPQPAPKARPASTYAPPDWSQSGPSTFRPEPGQRYQYSWQKKDPRPAPAWIPRFAALARHFVGSGFFWAFIIIQFAAILALPTGAPLIGTTGWTIVWLASFALPVVAVVIGVRKTAE